jgi:hypothetical protein
MGKQTDVKFPVFSTIERSYNRVSGVARTYVPYQSRCAQTGVFDRSNPLAQQLYAYLSTKKAELLTIVSSVCIDSREVDLVCTSDYVRLRARTLLCVHSSFWNVNILTEASSCSLVGHPISSIARHGVVYSDWTHRTHLAFTDHVLFAGGSVVLLQG